MQSRVPEEFRSFDAPKPAVRLAGLKSPAPAATQTRAVVPFDAEALANHRRLVARIATGDAEALQLLYLELNGHVHGVVRRVLEDPEDAREAVQDTFIKVWQQARIYRPDRGEVVSWVVFIARNAAIDRLRKGARRRLLHEALRQEPVDNVVPITVHYDDREMLTRHLGQLTPPQRQALELAFFGGCTHVQIAGAMQMPLGNVKNHLRRGLQKLRQIVLRHD